MVVGQVPVECCTRHLARGAQHPGAVRLHSWPLLLQCLQNPEVNSRRPGRFARRSAPSPSRAPPPPPPPPKPGAPSPALLGPPGSGLRPRPGAPPALPGAVGNTEEVTDWGFRASSVEEGTLELGLEG